ncbi:MAG: preprotein translocase subunit SecA [Candidatus Cloacimonadota bacterium]|nr:MAG: preprotein translocase subunit SecA [Candidatus Cloacimonadota bacterium]PIE81417.1 MAG: preprotein translocase subunit SecA [Candidatus Delongbacteria bacterium]
MINFFLNKIFGTKQEREVKKLKPIVSKVNQYCEEYSSFEEQDFLSKTQEFKDRIKNGESLESIIPEAFGLVKQACIKMCGNSWIVDGREQEWKMVPYDVQIMGGILLARGRIAEMATGEGKTLVAIFPTYLHGLTGKGVHVITVNDYLAKRDRDWMAPIYELLGLSVGVIHSDVKSNDVRKGEYEKDITYGVNHEFGFDYLRDNMVHDIDEMVQRGWNFCLIDEVDSILIDEARVPLIISGAVSRDTKQRFEEFKPAVSTLVREQTKFVNHLVSEGEKLIENPETEKEGHFKLLQSFKALPKHKRLAKVLNKTGVKTAIQKLENDYLREKRIDEVLEGLYYTLDERSNTVDLGQKGHDLLSKFAEEENMFILPDLGIELQNIDSMDISENDKEIKKQTLHDEYSKKSDILHTLHQLLKAYSLFEKDVDYVVQDGKVIIVDQSTGRLKLDSRFSDGMHQSIEAKEGVAVGQDTQTIASITYQNYFRLYKNLSGMTGTAITEENEFYDIYKLPVSVVPTNVPIARNDQEDMVYKTKKEKYDAVVENIKALVDEGRPVLVGTPDVDVSEVLSRYLRAKGIEHQLLNAKNHAKEAHIVAEAGRAGRVTIATNMAGRGTDIKLTDEVKSNGGLAIIGCERHNSRRIDRQLRGRAGRQGDPGSSIFYVSLEDNLMRIFGSEKISSVMDKFGHQEGEAITHKWISKSIERSQKRVEAHYFASRKHTLEYDDVMNKQRNVIYHRRRKALIKGAIFEGKDVPFAKEYGVDPTEKLENDVFEMIQDYIHEVVFSHTGNTDIIENWDIDGINDTLTKSLFISFDLDEIEIKTYNDLVDLLVERAKDKFIKKIEVIGEEMMNILIKIAIIRTIDKNWQDHLYDNENLMKGVGLVAHSQKDPLITYKQQSFESFKQMIYTINEEALEIIFKAQFKVEVEEDEKRKADDKKMMKNAKTNSVKEEKVNKREPLRSGPRVGRNDPCPCGSGKKYKSCHGANE